MTPRPEQSLLQIITGVAYHELFGIHKKAHVFLLEKGLKVSDLSEQEFRAYFLKNIHMYADHVRTYVLWPVLLIYWTIIRRGRIHCREIENQFQHGFVKLPEV
jgi:hypothetical protein